MRHKKTAKPHTESRIEYIAALVKYPENLPRKQRRATWHAHRRDSATHEVMLPNLGTHTKRANTWRELWPLMSEQASYMNKTRTASLLSAANVGSPA